MSEEEPVSISDSETQLLPLPEDETLDAVEAALELAKRSNSKATKELLENANEYVKPALEQEKLIKVARRAQMASSKAWYDFWTIATKIPKDNKYATFTTAEKRTWKAIVKSNEDFLKEIVVPGGIDGVTWKNVLEKDGITILYSPEKSEQFKTRIYKIQTVLTGVSPRLALLALIRGPVLGAADENLLYFREHYNFVGGSTSLVHHVRKLTKSTTRPRDFFDLTHWSEEEDGSIIFTSSSLKAFPTRLPGVARGATLFKGCLIIPNAEGGVEITMISQVSPKGWAFKSYLNWNIPSMLHEEMSAINAACNMVKDDDNEELFIRKFVLREIIANTEEE